MRILVNHLTRMRGGHICVAGLDVETRQHVRPVLQHESIPFYLLARYGGPFDMARIVDLGAARPHPQPPHVEDCVFVASRARVERTATAHEFWSVLEGLAKARLRAIFGSALQAVGQSRYGTAAGRGLASLGCFRPCETPALYLVTSRERKPRIRIKITDGEIHADVGVTDLRLCKTDHATPDAHVVRSAAEWIEASQGVILGVGLTRKFRSSDHADCLHWLQVNNIHLKEDPVWQLR